MRRVLESDKYAFYYDAIQGVGRFVRLSDEAVTLFETGYDCQLILTEFKNLLKRVGSDTWNYMFNQKASSYEFS